MYKGRFIFYWGDIIAIMYALDYASCPEQNLFHFSFLDSLSKINLLLVCVHSSIVILHFFVFLGCVHVPFWNAQHETIITQLKLNYKMPSSAQSKSQVRDQICHGRVCASDFL